LKQNNLNFPGINGLASRKILRGPRGQNYPPACPNLALCPNDFSLDVVTIQANLGSISVTLQIEYW